MTPSKASRALGLSLLLLGLAGSACADIILGHSGDLSGTSAKLTADYVRGMNAYFDHVNKQGGIRGEKIKLISIDDAFNPDRTVQNTKELIEKHNALALVGLRGTANLLKIVPVIQAAGIPQIGNTSGAKALRNPHVPYMFHMRAADADMIESAVNHAWTIGIQKIGVAYQDDVFGQQGLEALKESMAKRNAKLVAVAPIPRGTVDVAKAIEVLGAAQPQAILLLAQAKPAGAIIKGIHAQRLYPQFIALSVASGLHDEIKEEASGVIVTQIVPYPFSRLGNSVVNEYQGIISQTDTKKFSFNSLEGFLNAKLVVRALQKTPPPLTRAKLVNTLESFTNEDLGGFALSYSKQNNLGSRYVNLTMIRADGSFVQ